MRISDISSFSSSSYFDIIELLDSFLPSIPYHPSFLVGPLGCIQCLYRADVYKFLLGGFVRWEVGGHIFAPFWDVASRICSR